MVYQTEKTLEEMGDKIDAADKSEIDGALAKLKEALKGTDTAAIKAETEALTQVFYKVSEKLYAQADPQATQNGAGAAGGANYTDANTGTGNDQQYYDADYEVVDDDNNNK